MSRHNHRAECECPACRPATPPAGPGVPEPEQLPTPDQLAEWRRLADAASPGPWEMDGFASVRTASDGRGFIDYVPFVGEPESLYPVQRRKADARFIAAARLVLPALLDAYATLYSRAAGLAAERDEARAKLAELGKELKDYQDAAEVEAAEVDDLNRELDLAAAEASSVGEAVRVLFAALGWSGGGLGSAALEIVGQRDEARAAHAAAEADAGRCREVMAQFVESVPDCSNLESNWCRAHDCHKDRDQRCKYGKFRDTFAALLARPG